MLDDMVNSGKAKWQVWTNPAKPAGQTNSSAGAAQAPSLVSQS
jgi:hypothetical protein